ncbi:2-dehydropantoate 2-reductase [Vibrio sp. UCD-FRSSP16_10]|uniref:2-dehydropantoate 2-reductase n=1 Tax=unclassified Vibrio TaxID=2614977 RepID=UPI00080047F5|nr:MULTISPECIES: 2-dehydropantoate 2-reductase [unclassified Vibrio]OBT06562.1 2-dehydropantoate 2-reductase [Vibrio sp. UCD-FRSSP16_30]OBT12259.1 2-dehydropantoate 2-reductase [Vibrio sp. UCD-FRSSP16_10]
MNICILGAGAIGSLWACYLHKAGHNVSLWTKGDEPSIALSLDDQPTMTFKANQTTHLSDADLVLIAVKAWQVQSATQPILPFIKPSCTLLFTHNGMGVIQALLPQLNKYNVLFATTTHGALKQSQSKLKHTGYGRTTIGQLNQYGTDVSRSITEVLHQALSPVYWDDNIQQALWNKLAINCCINPLTAIRNCRNGELSDPITLAFIDSLCLEISSVINAQGLICKREALFEQVQQVIQATKDNYSSMHQDIYHGRVTEIDYITGYLIQRAQAHNLNVPLNEKLFKQIKQQEASL